MALLCIYSGNNKKHESEKSDWKSMANFSFTLYVLFSVISDGSGSTVLWFQL